MPTFKLIGLVGRAGAGKDTVASILAETEGVTPIAFADALREEVKNAFGVGIECMLQRDEKEQPTQALAISRCADRRFINRMLAIAENPYTPRSPREILQLWGTEYRRECDSFTYWIDRLQDTIDYLATGGKPVVVTDVLLMRRFISNRWAEVFGASIVRAPSSLFRAIHPKLILTKSKSIESS